MGSPLRDGTFEARNFKEERKGAQRVWGAMALCRKSGKARKPRSRKRDVPWERGVSGKVSGKGSDLSTTKKRGEKKKTLLSPTRSQAETVGIA